MTVTEILYRMGRAREVLGDKKKSEQWLSTKLDSLGGRTPMDIDADEFDILIGRIEHGVFS